MAIQQPRPHAGLEKFTATLRGTAAEVFDGGRLHIGLAAATSASTAALQLTRREYALSALLLQHVGRVVTQPQLLREVWGPTHQHDTHYLRILVGKLGDDAAAPRYIAT